ncbi:MAG: hypothetical protein Q4F35_08175 [Akkermansia sp.]|nr:hypothetical protein [Akkermansia sp.]
MEIKIVRNKQLDIAQTDTKGYETEKPITFCFVGPRGVGKTSLLASMYYEIKQSNVMSVKVDALTKIGERTQESLDESHKQMLNMIEKTPMKGSVDLRLDGKGIVATQGENHYEFICEGTVEDTDLTRMSKYKRFRYRCKFIDMPGGWYKDVKIKDKAKALEYLKNSAVSFLAIDTPAIMEGDNKNKHSNSSEAIANCYDNVRDELAANKHTVIIVLSRCERYWNERERMLEQLDQYYGSLINRLKAAGVEVIVTWVKTLGGMEFLQFRKNDDQGYTARFIRVGNYAPENCSTPLQLALSRGIARMRDSIKPGFFFMFDVKKFAIQAAAEIASELKRRLLTDDKDSFKLL